MQRNPHSYQIATGYRTFYSLSLIYQPITKKRLFFVEKHNAFGSDGINQSYFISLYAIFCHFYGCFLNGGFSIVFLDGVLNCLREFLYINRFKLVHHCNDFNI